MKRSSQVLLVLMGVTTTTAVGHYLAPPRPTECVQQAQTAKPGTPQEVTQPCRTTSSRSGGGGSGSHTWWRSSRSENGGASSAEHGKVAASTSTSGSEAARGGFGSTGHGISSSS
jgi:hypothetical protein